MDWLSDELVTPCLVKNPRELVLLYKMHLNESNNPHP